MVPKTLILPKAADIAEYTTKGELAAQLYPSMVYDTALPQDWVNDMTLKGFDPRPCVVWGYPVETIMGKPFPLTQEAEAALKEFANISSA